MERGRAVIDEQIFSPRKIIETDKDVMKNKLDEVADLRDILKNRRRDSKSTNRVVVVERHEDKGKKIT